MFDSGRTGPKQSRATLTNCVQFFRECLRATELFLTLEPFAQRDRDRASHRFAGQFGKFPGKPTSSLVLDVQAHTLLRVESFDAFLPYTWREQNSIWKAAVGVRLNREFQCIKPPDQFLGIALEGLSRASVARHKPNRWRRHGKSLYDIFGDVASPDENPFVYGTLSEPIHGSWNESMVWCLSRNDEGTFSAFALFVGVDSRAILPLVRFATPAYALWVERPNRRTSP